MESQQPHLSGPSFDRHASHNCEGADGALLRDSGAENTESFFRLKELRK